MADIDFTIKVRGYDKKEVDEYIAKIHSEYAEVCAHLQQKIKTLEQSIGSQEDIANAMIHAQTIVRRMEEDGRTKADKIVNDARIESEEIIGSAKDSANRILGDAQAKVDKAVRECEIKAQGITLLAETNANRIINQAKQSRENIKDEMQQVFNIASIFLKEIEDEADSGSLGTSTTPDTFDPPEKLDPLDKFEPLDKLDLLNKLELPESETAEI